MIISRHTAYYVCQRNDNKEIVTVQMDGTRPKVTEEPYQPSHYLQNGIFPEDERNKSSHFMDAARDLIPTLVKNTHHRGQLRHPTFTDQISTK